MADEELLLLRVRNNLQQLVHEVRRLEDASTWEIVTGGDAPEQEIAEAIENLCEDIVRDCDKIAADRAKRAGRRLRRLGPGPRGRENRRRGGIASLPGGSNLLNMTRGRAGF